MHKVKEEMKTRPEAWLVRVQWDNGLVSHLHTYTCDYISAWMTLDIMKGMVGKHATAVRLVRKEQDGPKGHTFKSAWDAYQARCKANEQCNQYGMEDERDFSIA